MPGMVTSHRACRFFLVWVYINGQSAWYIQYSRTGEIPSAAPLMLQQKYRHDASFCFQLAEVPTQWASWTQEKVRVAWPDKESTSRCPQEQKLCGKIHADASPTNTFYIPMILFVPEICGYLTMSPRVYVHRTKSFDAMWVCRYIANRQLFECLWCLCVSEIGGWLTYLVK